MIGKRSTVNLEKYTVKDLKNMVEAGLKVVEWHRFLVKNNVQLVKNLLPRKEAFYQFDLSPSSNAAGYESPSQLSCHALRTGKHAHFHIFLRDKTIPQNHRSTGRFAVNGTDQHNGKICHLFAISMDPYGIPIRLFTTNLSITGENWRPARDILTKAERFQFDPAQPSWVVSRWVTAMLRLFRPQIREMLEERDRAVAKWKRKRAGKYIFGNWELCFSSIKEISVEEQNDALLKELSKRLVTHSSNMRVGKQRNPGARPQDRTNINKTCT